MSSRQSILFLTPQIPYPPHQGASLRNFFIIKGAAHHMDVDLLTFRDPHQSVDRNDIAPLLALLDRFEWAPTPKRSTTTRLITLLTSPLPDMGHRLESDKFTELLAVKLASKRYDIIQIEGIELARYLPLIKQMAPQAHILFDNHNAETDLQRRIYERDSRSRSPKRLLKAIYSRMQVTKLDRFERLTCQIANTVTAVSEADASIMSLYRKPGQSAAIPIPNMIDVEAVIKTTPPPPYPTSDLLFIGKMDYRPNVDGMLWFIQEIWPLIRRERPQTKMVIVGKNPTGDILSAASGQQIEVTGFVNSVAPYLAGTEIMVMPLRMGSGTRLKLIEALASGKPVVSTTLAAEGYQIEPNHEIVLEDKPDRFAAAVLRLLNDPEERSKLGQQGRARSLDYDWRKVVPRFKQIYSAVGSEAST